MKFCDVLAMFSFTLLLSSLNIKEKRFWHDRYVINRHVATIFISADNREFSSVFGYFHAFKSRKTISNL